ncbi:Spt21 protein [Saccharomycopsis crataegensis]|uniref:Spt21 protein n=1 Tax=Saccharomycopsis crataegensis TaxID=43959 RepID=A0AAV5QRU7_9ASCO|nr:Spt21 protein [Saccharomycopsis crataegensis]
MSTKTSMMGLKVTYSFDDTQAFLSRSASDMKIKFGEMELFNNETRLIGVVKLRECLQAVMRSSPEVMSNLATKHDYTIYVCDYSEVDTPLVGYGTLSNLINNDFTDVSDDEPRGSKSGKAKDILIPGKVETNIASLLYGNSKTKNILSVKLNFKIMERQKPKFDGIPFRNALINNNNRKTSKSKRITNPTPAPKATRTYSLPIRPLEFLPPNTNLTKNQSLADQLRNLNNATSSKRKSLSNNDSSIKKLRKHSNSSLLQKTDEAFLNHSSLVNSLVSFQKPSKIIEKKKSSSGISNNSDSNTDDNETKAKPGKKNSNYWIIMEDNKERKDGNKENVPPNNLSSEVSDFSISTNSLMSCHNVSSAPTSDNSEEYQLTGFIKKQTENQTKFDKELEDLFEFDPDNFLNNVYNNTDQSQVNNNVATSTPLNNNVINLSNNIQNHLIPIHPKTLSTMGLQDSTLMVTPDDNGGTPKDSEALTPIIESASDKDGSDDSDNNQQLATSPVYDDEDESIDKLPLRSSPFSVYD